MLTPFKIKHLIINILQVSYLKSVNPVNPCLYAFARGGEVALLHDSQKNHHLCG